MQDVTWYRGEPRPTLLNILASPTVNLVPNLPPPPEYPEGFTDSDAQRVFTARVKAAAEAKPTPAYQPNRHERRRAKILAKRKG